MALPMRLPLFIILFAATPRQPGAVSSSGPPSASSCGLEHASAREPFQNSAASGAGLALIRGAVAEEDLANLLAAERAAWADPFTVEHGLANHTRRITSSPVSQSVTWLHRQRAAASGAIERVQVAALAAQRDAGWGLTDAFTEGALSVRCVESIRYAVSGYATGEPDGTSTKEAAEDPLEARSPARHEEGWHVDEWSVRFVYAF